MDLYSKTESSVGKKYLLVCIQVFFTLASGVILLFQQENLRLGLWVIVGFNIATTVRFLFTLFVFINRKIPLEEALSVVFAFGLYYVGFSIFTVWGTPSEPVLIVVGILLFVLGALTNSVSEYQRFRWKKRNDTAGKIFTSGLFRFSRHPNFFGDFLWVLGYALVTQNPWALTVPILIFFFFLLFNIPLQEKHMMAKYGSQYEAYAAKTKSFVPFIV